MLSVQSRNGIKIATTLEKNTYLITSVLSHDCSIFILWFFKPVKSIVITHSQPDFDMNLVLDCLRLMLLHKFIYSAARLAGSLGQLAATRKIIPRYEPVRSRSIIE